MSSKLPGCPTTVSRLQSSFPYVDDIIAIACCCTVPAYSVYILSKFYMDTKIIINNNKKVTMVSVIKSDPPHLTKFEACWSG